MKKKGTISELRQDLVSGDWVTIATGRAKRPHDFLKQRRIRARQPKRTCPFEGRHDDALGAWALDEQPIATEWRVEVIPNKFPAFGRGVCSLFHPVGPYQWTEGHGFHEVVIMRDHNRSIAEMSDEEVELVIRAYHERFLAFKNDPCIQYVAVFHNHGALAGATITHPHSQIIAIPVVPPDVRRSLDGTAAYLKEHNDCVHCVMLRFEVGNESRMVYENEYFVALAPFASRTAFELRIFPKRHRAYFEDIAPAERIAFANALRVVLAKLFRGLDDPDYNFFIHTAPIGEAALFKYYHWHLEIVPKTAIWAGFEIGTGIEISTIAPEDAAAFLRKIRIR